MTDTILKHLALVFVVFAITQVSPTTAGCPCPEESAEPEICTIQCNNPYYCAKEDKTNPWPCGNPYGCGPWNCAANTWMCTPPKGVVNLWQCANSANCKPPGRNPWNCTSPWNCSIPQGVKDEFGCTNPWDCKPSKNNVSNCRSPFDCRPSDAIMACFINPQPSCASTAGAMQDIPPWMFLMMMSNAQRLSPQVGVPNIQQNQSVSWNGKQFVGVNFSPPENPSGPISPGQGLDISSGMSVRNLYLSNHVAGIVMLTVLFLPI